MNRVGILIGKFELNDKGDQSGHGSSFFYSKRYQRAKVTLAKLMVVKTFSEKISYLIGPYHQHSKTMFYLFLCVLLKRIL